MDDDLIRRCQSGDTEAFAALYEEQYSFVYRAARLALGDPHQAEDALQDVFLTVFRSIGSFQPAKGPFRAWLYRVTVNHCRNLRRRQRLTAFWFGSQSADHGEWPDPAAGELPEGDHAVWQAVDRLRPKLRVVVQMRFTLDLSYDEIAHALNLPVGTVKSRLAAALKTLHGTLTPTGEMNDVNAVIAHAPSGRGAGGRV